MQDNTSLTLRGNIALTNSGTNTFTFCGSTPTELAYVHWVTSAIQTQLDSAITKKGSTALTGNITLGSAYTFSGATPTEIGYLSGVTLAIQTQLNTNFSSSGGTVTGSISCTGLTDSDTMT